MHCAPVDFIRRGARHFCHGQPRKMRTECGLWPAVPATSTVSRPTTRRTMPSASSAWATSQSSERWRHGLECRGERAAGARPIPLRQCRKVLTARLGGLKGRSVARRGGGAGCGRWWLSALADTWSRPMRSRSAFSASLPSYPRSQRLRSAASSCGTSALLSASLESSVLIEMPRSPAPIFAHNQFRISIERYRDAECTKAQASECSSARFTICPAIRRLRCDGNFAVVHRPKCGPNESIDSYLRTNR